MKSLSRGESAFVALIILCASLTAYALARDIAYQGTLRGQRVGSITWKDRYAEQRQEGSGLWVAAAKDGPVYNHDTIRTGENSAATIKLDNKTEISLDSGSMVYIRVDAASEKATISLKGGSIKVAQKGSAKPVSLETASGSVAVTEGTVRVSGDGERMTVRAETPEAKIVSPQAAEPITINTASDFDVSTSEIKAAPLSVQSPARESVIVANGTAARVEFAWTPAANPVPLEVALDGSFKKIVRAENSLASGSSLELPEGRYWWRIPGTTEKGAFTVLRGGACTPQSPIDKRFVKASETVTVQFSWARQERADSYRIDLFADGKGDEPVMTRTVTQRSTTLDVAEPGDYSWTVTAFYGPDRVEFASARPRFSVVTAELPAPERPTIARGIATWKAVDGADRYELRISADSAGSSVRHTMTTPGAYASVKKTVPDGTWYVSVRALSNALLSPWSEPTVYEIRPPQPLAAVAPANGAALEASKGKVVLSWNDPNGGLRYRVSVSRSADLSNPVAELSANRASSPFPLPDAAKTGTYYWKVTLQDAAGATVSESPVSSFTVREPLAPPRPIGPTDGTKLDINALNDLSLEWEPVSGAEYYIVNLYRMTAGMPKAVGSWKTATPSQKIKDFSKLAIDSFSWNVVAVRTYADGTEGKSDPAAAYFSIVQSKILMAPSIKIMKSRGTY